jgi:hypothetical protein
MVINKIIDFKDPKLSQDLQTIEASRTMIFNNLNKFLTKVFSIIF